MRYPHEVVGDIADGILGGIRRLGNGVVGGVEGVGESVMSALDKPLSMITNKQGPHRAIDRLAKGTINSAVHFVDTGVIGSIQDEGHAIMQTLDHPLEQLGGEGIFKTHK
jgi:hypothetical protein